MGVVHVLTGPDHLSALATLSANVGNYHAFWYGVRWGVGHSIGLVVVGSFFIIISNVNGDGDTVEVPESVEAICESFVGIFMFGVLIYSLATFRTTFYCENYDRDSGEELNVIFLQFIELSVSTLNLIYT